MTSNTQHNLIVIGSWSLAIGLFTYMTYRYVLSNYSIKPITGSINHIDLDNNELDIDLIFELKSSIGIGFVVKDIELDVAIQGVKVGHISKGDAIQVPSNGKTTVAIPMSLDISTIKDNALGLFTSLSSGLQVEINGYSTAYISGIPMGINVSISEIIKVI